MCCATKHEVGLAELIDAPQTLESWMINYLFPPGKTKQNQKQAKKVLDARL
jgi:hypothetical protein